MTQNFDAFPDSDFKPMNYSLSKSKLTFFLFLIKDAPVIEPFIVPASVHSGQRLSITCTVTRGDPPLIIKWLYDNQIIEEDGSATNSLVKVYHLTDYSSTLLFESVKKSHRGNDHFWRYPLNTYGLIGGEGVCQKRPISM